MSQDNISFPDNFIWGAATSSYQIEGAHEEDGRGESIWDRFCTIPGKILNGDRGDLSCDHYHRCDEDIGLMKEIGLKAYRFSVAWPRIFPQGGGKVNKAGLDFYNRLVDGLLDADIDPFLTLYHWDLPQTLQEKGGWGNRDTVNYFVDYVGEVYRSLGDRVFRWTTHNEPWIVSFLGHQEGRHAPGVKELTTAIQVSHHLLLSHGKAVEVIRESGDDNTLIGIILDLHPIHPASEREEDQNAAVRYDGYFNRWFLDPIFVGSYPEDILELYGDKIPKTQEGDLEAISAKIDFLGVNYYYRTVVKDDPKGDFLGCSPLRPEGREYTGTDREVYDGVNLGGYFVWSLMDNFEWSLGYSKRYGITYVDYPSQRRVLKSSGAWYSELIRGNGFEVST